MPDYRASIIIPVFNRWDLTRECLHSLASNTAGAEVIVVDNASSDATLEACPPLGKNLFGDAFRYVRNGVNRNFAGASNQGARMARGEFLVFLNNDTEAQPGWLEPLLEDFHTYPDIGATGPLLVYPEETPLGRVVQHLGVYVTPFMNLGHLYEGVPAASPLATKRRFLQAITAACMAMPKELFLDAGAFDEGFINGFEDIDLCARLWHRGLRMTVNPASQVIHHESQTSGRHEFDEHNSVHLANKGGRLLLPDWHVYLANDGLALEVDSWLIFRPSLNSTISGKLDNLAKSASPEHIRTFLITYPYWENGWKALLDKTGEAGDRETILRLWFKLFRNPEAAFAGCELTCDAERREEYADFLQTLGDSPQSYLRGAMAARELCSRLGLADLAAQYAGWLANYDSFEQAAYIPFTKKYLELAKKYRLPSLPLNGG